MRRSPILIRIDGLVDWAEESVKKLGHQKTETILYVAEIMEAILAPAQANHDKAHKYRQRWQFAVCFGKAARR